MKNLIIILTFLLIGGCSMTPKPSVEAKPLPNFDTLWNYSDPKGTEAKFRELIPQAKESGDTSYYAQLLTQIARAEGLQRKFEEAHKGFLTHISWSNGGTMLATSASDGTIAIWDRSKARRRSVVDKVWETEAMEFSPDDRWLAVATKGGFLTIYRC